MNCDGKMSFGSFIFPINPYLLKITHRRTVAKAAVLYGYPAVSDMGGGVCEISGEGEFFGENALESFRRNFAVKIVFSSLRLCGSILKTAGAIFYIFPQRCQC